MKLEEIVKGIVENKDHFNNLNESTSSPELENIVKNIVDQYFKDINEVRGGKLKYANSQELSSIARGYVKEAIKDLETYYDFEFDDRQRNLLVMWLGSYTSLLINALSGKDIPV